MSNDINPINVNQSPQSQSTKEKKEKEKEEELLYSFDQQPKTKAEGKINSPAEALAALNKEVADNDVQNSKADKKGDKGKKPAGGDSKEDPDTTTSPLLQAALSGDATSLAQLNTLLADRDPAMVLSAQKAINSYNSTHPQKG